MSSAVSPKSEHSHPSSRGQTARSHSTRSRPPPPSATSPQRAASTSNHHSRQSSSTRPIQDILPQNDYETSNVGQYSKRSSSRDAPSSTTRTTDPSRPQRRGSTRSNHNPQPPQPDMPVNATVVNNAGPAPVNHGTADARPPAAAKPSRSRTTIPTQSGKWILGKTIGAGSMGKVKLARKEDGSEQVSSAFALGLCRRFLTVWLHRLRARSYREVRPKMATTAEPIRTGQTSPRRSGRHGKRPSLRSSTILTSAASEMWLGQTTTGTCSSSLSTEGRCWTTSSPTAS